MADNNLIIFDTTLRDGEQSPGASMTQEEKLRIAKTLEKMRVDVIEAGFAIASPGDFASVKAIADSVKDSTICSLSRALDKDIDRAAEALKNANSGRIHTFIATSPIHMQYKLKMQPEEVVAQAVHAVKRARNLVADVEFSCEDAGRSELPFLCQIIEAAIDAGASTINIPDTVGYALPHEFGDKIKYLLNNIPNADKAIFSVHCHNDLGLAVANSIAAVANGARQVECTINGLGERAGNASLEEVVMALRTRHDLLELDTNIDTSFIVPASRLVSSVTGFPVQPNKAIVGANAFAHESGIHQDGILKHRETYEIMRAEDVGWKNNKLIMGKHSGRNAFKSKMEELDINFENDEALNSAFARFKELADKKHDIYDEDLTALMSAERSFSDNKDHFKFVSMTSSSQTGSSPKASIVMNVDGKEHSVETTGDGQVDALFKGIESLAHSHAKLSLYSVNAVTQGIEAQGEVTVRLERDGRIVNGMSADTDVIAASAKAYINALNLLWNEVDKAHPQPHHL